MRLVDLRAYLATINEDFDEYHVRTLPGPNGNNLIVVPERRGQNMIGSKQITGVLLIQEAEIE